MPTQEQSNPQDSDQFLNELWASQSPEIQYILQHNEQSVQAELLRQLIPLLHFHSLTVDQLAQAFMSNLELGTVLKDEYERRYSFEDITDVAPEDLQDFQARLARQKDLDPKLKAESQTARVHAQVIESLVVRIVEWYASVGNFEIPEELRQQQVEGHLERLEQIEAQVSQAQPEAGFIVAGVINEIKQRVALYTSWKDVFEGTTYDPQSLENEGQLLRNVINSLKQRKPEWFEQCQAEFGEDELNYYQSISCLEILTPGQIHEVFRIKSSLPNLARILFHIYRHHSDTLYEGRNEYLEKRTTHEAFLPVAAEILEGKHDTQTSLYDLICLDIDIEEELVKKSVVKKEVPPDNGGNGNDELKDTVFSEKVLKLNVSEIAPRVPDKVHHHSNPEYAAILVAFLKWAEAEVRAKSGGMIPRGGWNDAQINAWTGTSERDRLKLQRYVKPTGEQIGKSYYWLFDDVKILFIAKILEAKGWGGPKPRRMFDDLRRVVEIFAKN